VLEGRRLSKLAEWEAQRAEGAGGGTTETAGARNGSRAVLSRSRRAAGRSGGGEKDAAGQDGGGSPRRSDDHC
jgi:hypothetical protein